MSIFGTNYAKEGPGIDKNAPKKHVFFVFWETFFRNFWKFAPISFVYSIICLLGITSGLASAGMTHVARNTARDKHSFGFSDFFETIIKNWKQALGAGIINTIINILLIFNTYYFLNTKGTIPSLLLGVTLFIFFVFTIMNYYIWTLLISFKFSLKQIYKNSFRFVFINLKNNLICFLSQTLIIGIFIAILFLAGKYWIHALVFEVVIYAFTFPTFKYLLIQFCVFGAIKKYIIDPYYEEHPDDDIEMRRNLGLIEPEPIEDIDSIDSENNFIGAEYEEN